MCKLHRTHKSALGPRPVSPDSQTTGSGGCFILYSVLSGSLGRYNFAINLKFFWERTSSNDYVTIYSPVLLQSTVTHYHIWFSPFFLGAMHTNILTPHILTSYLHMEKQDLRVVTCLKSLQVVSGRFSTRTQILLFTNYCFSMFSLLSVKRYKHTYPRLFCFLFLLYLPGMFSFPVSE